jgi:hypothetical protein
MSKMKNLALQIEELDLVDEMNWEDSPKVEKLSLFDAGLEEDENPVDNHFSCGIFAYLKWFYDGDLDSTF